VENINEIWDAIGVYAEAAIGVSQGDPGAVREYLVAGDVLKRLIGGRTENQPTEQEHGGGYV
jgi:hypothetical protein